MKKIITILMGILLPIMMVMVISCEDDSSTEPVEPTFEKPQNLFVTPGSNEIYLAWAKITDATEYKVYSVGTAIEEIEPQIKKTKTKYTVKNLQNDETYKFAIKAVFGDGMSELSDTVTVTPKSNYQIDIPETSKSFDDEDIENVTYADNQLELSLKDTAVANGITANDVLYFDSSENLPEGLLLKVVSVSRKGNNSLALQTEEASLDEFIKNIDYSFDQDYGKIVMKVTLPNGEVKNVEMKSKSGERGEVEGEYTFKHIIKQGNEKLLELKFIIKVKLKLDFDLKINWHSCEHFLFKIAPDVDVQFDVINKAKSFNFDPDSINLGKFEIPIVLPFGANLVLRLKDKMEINIKPSLNFNVAVLDEKIVTAGAGIVSTCGVEYDGTNVTPLNSFGMTWLFGFPIFGINNLANLLEPDWYSNWNASVTFKNNLSLKQAITTWGIEGPIVELNTKFPELKFQYEKPYWDLTFAVDNIKFAFNTDFLRKISKKIPGELAITFPAVNIPNYSIEYVSPVEDLELITNNNKKYISFSQIYYNGNQLLTDYEIYLYKKSDSELINTITVNSSDISNNDKKYYILTSKLSLPADGNEYEIGVRSLHNISGINWLQKSSLSDKVTIIIQNTPPTAVFTVSPEWGTTSTDFQFDASGCSDNEDPTFLLEVRWDFDGDGSYDTSWSVIKTASHQYSILGSYGAVVQVRDQYGLDATITHPVYVSETVNTPPTASFIASPGSGTTATDFLFDANGSTDPEDPTSSLQVRWDFDGDGNYDTDWKTDKSEEYQYSSIGTYNVKLQVKDTEGIDDTISHPVIVSDGNVNPGEMVLVNGGTFSMGDHFNEGDSDELPLHDVTLDNFYIGKYEVTQAEWTVVMGSNPASGYGVGDNYPVYYVNWYNATEYCNALSISQGLNPCYTGSGADIVCDFSKNGYRLPTEAEWEYAARGGVHHGDNYKYSGTTDNLVDYAWYYSNNTPYGTKEVGTKLPNQLGIYDMSGNVYEWCWDWYGSSYYDSSPSSNPSGPASGSYRIRRGGGWISHAHSCRSANRDFYSPSYSYYYIGFRIVRTAE